MGESWNRRIERAEQLAVQEEAARPLLLFYARLLGLQKELYQFLQGRRDWRPSGSLERDLGMIRAHVPRLLQGIMEAGPEPLAVQARQLLDSNGSALDRTLLDYWRAPSDRQFFPKAVLQPYAQSLAEAHIHPVARELTRADNACRFCSGAPQLSILQTTGDADGGGRLLMCGTCLTAWPFGRVLCAHCGENDEHKLGYFRSPAFDYLRLDA